jgi:hypothetical protein
VRASPFSLHVGPVGRQASTRRRLEDETAASDPIVQSAGCNYFRRGPPLATRSGGSSIEDWTGSEFILSLSYPPFVGCFLLRLGILRQGKGV